MLMMLALGPDPGRTVAADAHDARFLEGQSQADAACEGQSQLMLMMLALVARLLKDSRS